MKTLVNRHVGWVLVALAWAGCSAATSGDGDDDDDASSTAGSAVGGAGPGGAAARGGAGEDLCEQDCSAIAAPDCFVSVCNDGTHPGDVGRCVVIADEDGTACDDGLFCTLDDSCQAGICTGARPNDCGATASECEVITCDEASQSCGTETLPDGAACTPTNLCQTGGACVGGACSGGVPTDCFFAPVPNECFNAVCNPQNGMCEPVAGNDGASCVDQNDLCSDGNTCSNGTCGGGGPKDCSALTGGCGLGACDPASGVCGTVPVMDGLTCDDLDACTSGEVCTMGTCGGGAVLTACSGNTPDACCPPSCQGNTAGAADYDVDCGCSLEDVLLEEASTGAPDFVSIRNTCSVAIDINPITLCIDPGNNATDCEDLPAFVLQPGEVLYLIEPNGSLPAPPALSISLINSQSYTWSNSGAVWLCNGPCTQGNAPNAYDAVLWDGSGSSNLPPGMTFTPGRVTGRDSINEAVIRQNTAGSYPNFLRSDWTVGPPSHGT
ncbi:MAG: hypothetical protein AAGN82_14010 [Myxococcota bacterium]